MENTLHILVVEDDMIDRMQLERLIHRSFPSAKTITTEHLDRALELLKNNSFDVVLLDLNLPDSHGLDTLTILFKQQPSASVIVTTGQGDTETGLKAIAQGAQDYLVKGEFDSQTLTRAISYSIERRKAAEERNKTLILQHGVNSLQQSLLKASPLEEKLKKVTDDIVKLFGADFCRIWLIKKGDRCQQGCVHAEVTEGPHICRYRDRCLYLVSSSGRYTHIDGKVHRRVPFGCYKIGRVASGEDHKFLTNDAQNDPRVHNHEWTKELGLVSFAGYQLRIEGGETLGVLALFSKQPIQPFEDSLLDGIGSTVALAVQQAHTSEQLRASEEKYRGLFESSNDAIMTIEPPSWKFTSCNPAALRLFKVESKEKFTSLGPWDTSPPQQPNGQTSAEKAKEMIEKAMKEGSNFFEWMHKRINGEDFPTTVMLTRMERGGKALLQATVRDITSRKKAEEAIIKERNKAKKYLDIAGVMIIVLNEDLTLHRINNKGCEILGYIESEILGKNWCDIFVPAEYKERVKDVLDSLMQGKAGNFEYYENPILTKDGRQRLIAWHNVAMWDEKNHINAILSSGEDITWRRKAEEDLKKNHQYLEKAYNETKSVQAQLIQSEKLASIGQLAAGVAHEMNTPVGFVASNFETLEKYIAKFKTLLNMYAELAQQVLTADKTHLAEQLAEIDRTARKLKIGFVIEDIEGLFSESKEGLGRVTKIIQNLRDFSRIDQAEAFDKFDINHGIETTLTVAKNAIKYHADVTTEFSDVPEVPCNASQINQVFLNILVNAAQAIESQQRNQNGSIKIRTYANETHVICEIEDNGPGIPKEYLEKVFDPFFTTKPAGKGTGLGLAVSYDIIINKHKGELLVDSTVGKGTKFTIKLPIKTANEKIADNADAPAEAQAMNPV